MTKYFFCPTRRQFVSGLAATVLTPLVNNVPALADDMVEPPILRDAVASGKLPPMKERLPANPKVIDFAAEDKEIGLYGGDMTMLLGKARDIRMMTVYSYARLVTFNTDFEIEPDILESLESDGDRVFTLKLRQGHRWSDGQPFTTEDFRYWWEEVATNEELNEGSVDAAMVPGGTLPTVTIIDELTVRYEWPVPNPIFPLVLAGSSPLYIYMPSHYMKRWHIDYADKAELDAEIAKENVSGWTALHQRYGRMYRQENPDLPVLDPWQNRTEDVSQRAVFERNPYYHRVDPEGRQLPYLDRVVVNLGSTDIIPAKAGAGESDLQARYISFTDYTFLKEAEGGKDFKVNLWTDGVSSQIGLYPNLNVADPVWHEVMNNPLFRRALSIGIDREELNQQLYFGLAKPGGNTVLPQSPLYDERIDALWTEYDPQKANEMLDEAGLDKRDTDGIRLLPDGRRAEIIIESAGESTDETDALQLLQYQWEKIGIKIFPRTLQRDLLRRRFLTGETQMSISKGLNVGLATADMNPEELAPVSAAQPNWPVWGQHSETLGTAGELPPEGPARDLLDLYNAWRQSSSTEERREIWMKMLDIYANQVFSIGVAGQTIQPVVVRRSLKNVPEEAVYAWAPTAFFGVYRPDTFFFSGQ